MSTDVLERWLEDVVATPGMTGLRSPDDARRVLLDDALRAAPVLEANPGPDRSTSGREAARRGYPSRTALPDRMVTLLEAERRKCEFLRQFTRALPNIDVVWGRAEEQTVDSFGVALAKALAKPPVAAELCLPLVYAGGVALLWVAESADEAAVSRVAVQLAAELEASSDGLLVLRKTGPTPAGFPRRSGMARKRPLS